jgi:hypothetical protein
MKKEETAFNRQRLQFSRTIGYARRSILWYSFEKLQIMPSGSSIVNHKYPNQFTDRIS